MEASYAWLQLGRQPMAMPQGHRTRLCLASGPKNERYWRAPADVGFAGAALVMAAMKKSRKWLLARPAAATPSLPVKVETKGVPVLVYAALDEVEEQALQQLVSLAESPLPLGHVAAMPDVHMGKGVAIGAVFASEKYVCPNAVGVDIGCGMCAVPVSGLHKSDLSVESMRKIQQLLKERIPTSFDSHKEQLPWAKKTLLDISNECPPTEYLGKRIEKEKKLPCQLGTLGGGNHFIEVVYSEDDEQVWCMLHSGSRHVGNSTAEHYDKIAGNQGVTLRGVHGSLNYLEVESEEGQNYLKDMLWCQAYARENRRSMLDLMVQTMLDVTGKTAEMDRVVNTHHNFCQCENCRVLDPITGKVEERKLWVTRKGATSAREGQYGIIPGSMGVGSYIVRGRGASGSWQSCSHGAGRTMSRTKAKKIIPQEDFEASMQGIVCDTHPSVKDEAPQAYKDLGKVLANQAELVEVQNRLLPLVNVKGFEDKSYGAGHRKKGGGHRNRKKSKNRKRKAAG
eukprot:TRINITY_DN80087_c0_g1_i1.p1 TRINITY_DN80087_c0_g1~~TRINITY_DN80087_c0_g1_i1.p1  ORF type:complete len:510 (-),score=75.23 TRINITY_DN80087_c0_g1_i1:133-1662(-)